MITAIIIDDEKSGRETLHFMLKRHFFKKVIVLDMASSVDEGVKLIEKHGPQLVFLDIEMPKEMGLSIVNRFEKVNFEIIVTTAFRDYGIDAIKSGVFDYLLKPVDIDEIERALNRLEQEIQSKEEVRAIRKIIHNTDLMAPPPLKIPLLVSNNKTIFVDVKTIVRCEASGNYTKFHFMDGKTELITKLIKDVEVILTGNNFFRPHKSHLINIDCIKSFSKTEKQIQMIDNSLIPLSRNVKSDFLIKMKI